MANPPHNMAAKKKPRPFPSEDRTDRRPRADAPMGVAALVAPEGDAPAMATGELSEIERIVECATPEQFQQALSVVLRKMMVRGLREIPPPRSIKELQAIYDMFRKAEGIEARDRGGGAPSGGFLPRVVGRRALGSGVKEGGGDQSEVTTVEFPAESKETVTAEVVTPDVGVPEIDAADPLSGFEV